MAKLQEVEDQVASLSEKDYAAFCAWFYERQEAEVDRKLEAAVKAGFFDALADEARQEYAAGKTTPL